MFSNDLLKLTKIYCFYMELSVTIYILISCDFIDNVKGNVMDSSIHKSQEFDDYRACASNFEIHKDKIIRTEESKKMGAKYLNGKDVSSKDECMKFCCETSSCNVFVLEEKVLNQLQGTCYLFECGTPDDFKCKFTRHHNYSSAVMIVNRPQMQLENEIQYTQHERELTNLRMNENESNKSNYCHHGTRDNMAVDEPNPVAKEMKESSKILEDMDNTSFKSKGSKCSRYQFECRTSGECIAIYNACDGIPQCTDHSDEDVELGCPTTVLLTTVRNVKDLENVITFDKQSYNNLNANPINAQNTPPFSENNRILNPAEQNVLFKQQQQVQIPHQYLQYENNKMGVNQWKLNVNGQQLHGGSPSKNYMSSVNDKYSTPIQSNLPASPMDVTRDQVRAGPEGKLNGGTNFGAPSPWLSERSEGINIFNHNFGPLHNFNHKQNEVNIPYNYNGDFNNAPVNIPYDGYHDSVNGNNYPQNPSPWHKQYDNPLTSKNLKASEMGNTGSQESNNLRPEYYYEEAMKMKHTPTPNNP